MSPEKQMKVVSAPSGGVLSRLLALVMDYRLRWHWAGVTRELHIGG
jgi:hypothetical protein